MCWFSIRATHVGHAFMPVMPVMPVTPGHPKNLYRFIRGTLETESFQQNIMHATNTRAFISMTPQNHRHGAKQSDKQVESDRWAARHLEHRAARRVTLAPAPPTLLAAQCYRNSYCCSTTILLPLLSHLTPRRLAS